LKIISFVVCSALWHLLTGLATW